MIEPGKKEQRGNLANIRSRCQRKEGPTESHDSGVLEPPVGVANILLHKRENVPDNVVLHTVGHERQASSSSHRDGPLLVIHLLFLLGQQNSEDRDSVRESNLGKVAADPIRGLIGSLGLYQRRESERKITEERK